MIHAASAAPADSLLRFTPWQRVRRDLSAATVYTVGLVGYYALSRFLIGFERTTAPLWPGNGLLLAVCLLSAPRRWWQWAVLTVTVNLASAAFTLPGPLLNWFEGTAISLGQALAEAWLIQSWLKRPIRFERTREVFVSLAVVATVNLLTTPLAAAVSMVSPQDPVAFMQIRWLSHTVTAVTLMPFVVTWVIAWRERRAWQWQYLFRWLALFAGTVAVVALAIHPSIEGFPFLPAPHLCLLPVAAGAVMFRARGAAAVAVIIMLFVMVAATETDVWTGVDIARRMARGQLFLAIVSAAGLLFGASMAEIDARSRLLRESEARYRAAAERLGLALRTSGLGVWRRSLLTGDSEWDDRMFAIFGLARADHPPSAEQILAAIVPEDRIPFEQFWHNLPAREGGSRIACRLRRLDGEQRQVELYGIIEQGAAGDAGWVIGVANDTTDLLRAAAESESLKAQLQQAQKMEALGNLAAGVAHDFNTLLTGINVLVEMASTTLTPTHEATSLLQQARRGSASARVLVQRILNYSRGSRLPTTTACNVVELVRDTAPLLAAALPPNVSLSVEMHCDDAQVQADPAQLQQVLINLSTNAARAIADKPGKVDIRVDRFLFPDDSAANGSRKAHVRISVTDDGCGMDERTRARIFDPYFTPKPTGEGAGLGLSIVRDIVTAHAGSLEVESSPGTGTVVAVRLPLSGAMSA